MIIYKDMKYFSVVLLLFSTHIITAQRQIQYLIFEGGGPDEGPGPNQTINIASLKRTFGEINPNAQRMYAYGKEQVRFLTRSTTFVRSEIEAAFDLAEQTNVPLLIHMTMKIRLLMRQQLNIGRMKQCENGLNFH
jgi:hypothetical protein